MKKYLTALIAPVFAVAQAFATDHLVLVPARSLPPSAAHPTLAATLEHILTKTKPGTTISIIDPVDHSLQASFPVPAGTSRARAANRALKSQIPSFRAAFEARPVSSDWERGAIPLPDLIRLIKERIVSPGDRVDVVFFGDPKYRSASGVFDFVNGCVPSDGWLLADLAESPYATGSDAKALDGWGIFVVTVPANWAETEWQRSETERFWTAFAQRQGAGLLLGDLNLVLSKLGQGIPRNISIRPVDPADRALVFRNKVFVRGQAMEGPPKPNEPKQIIEEPAPVVAAIVPAPVVEVSAPAIPPTVVEVQSTAVTVTETASVSMPPPLPTELATRLQAIPHAEPGQMVVSLVWENDARQRSGCDIDPWLTLKGVEGELYFDEMRVPKKGAPAASLRKDIIDARGLQARAADYEQITILKPVCPEDADLWLNVYKNTSRSAITVALRLEYQGHTYFKTIRFPAIIGDSAKNQKLRAQAPQWFHVDLAALVREQTTTAMAN